jgi:hypothetical protein
MPNDVEIRFNTRAGRAAVDQAMARILRRLAEETARGTEADAPRRSGFMASTVGVTGPGEEGRPAQDVGERHAAATPTARSDEAYAFVAASYALYDELKQPFMLPALQAALAELGRFVAEERL